MKNWKTLIGIVGFALMLVFATWSYNKLKDNYGTGGNLVIIDPAVEDGRIPDGLYFEDQDSNHSNQEEKEVTDRKNEQSNTNEITTEQVEAPDVTIYDEDGTAYQLSSFFGKPIVLNFWASWCGPCKEEMPGFQKIHKEYEDNIQFLMVNLTDGSRETVKQASEFIKDAGYTFSVYYDTNQDAMNTYGVFSIPATFFIDAEGHLVTYAIGALDTYTLRKGLEYIYHEE